MQCAWQVEIDGYCQRVLAKHWPDVRRWDDVRTFPPEPVDDWRVDVVCGGFPCQDISSSGKKEGIAGKRSGLWKEYARIVRRIRPKVVVVENVAAITNRGLGTVLGDLAACGFDAEWQVLPACAFGSPQRRERCFVVAYSHGDSTFKERNHSWAFDERWDYRCGLALAERRAGDAVSWVRRAVDGVSNRVDRLRCLGNAVVPQVAEWIGRRIVEAFDKQPTPEGAPPHDR